MIARSIHPIPAPPADEPSEASFAEAPRLRRRTNDPAREYAQRPGAVELLPNSVAALILCKKGWAKIERHQIKITLDGEDFFFASRDSVIIAAKNGTGERVLWALNRRAPDLLHLLSDDGRYIESVPRKGEAQWFQPDTGAYADAQAQIQRDAARLRDLHAGETVAAARDALANAASTHRLIQTFPTPATGVRPSTADTQDDHFSAAVPGRELFPKAEELTTAMRSGEGQRERHVARVVTRERRIAAETRPLSDLLPDDDRDGSPEPAEAEPEEQRSYSLSDLT